MITQITQPTIEKHATVPFVTVGIRQSRKRRNLYHSKETNGKVSRLTSTVACHLVGVSAPVWSRNHLPSKTSKGGPRLPAAMGADPLPFLVKRTLSRPWARMTYQAKPTCQIKPTPPIFPNPASLLYRMKAHVNGGISRSLHRSRIRNSFTSDLSGSALNGGQKWRGSPP